MTLTDFQEVRISLTTLESIHLNKSIKYKKERIKIFSIRVFCFNMWYYPMSKIWYSTLEMLSLHYILHVSCPVFVLWMVLQKSTKETIPRPFHSLFISVIPESWYITNICMGHWCWWYILAWLQVRGLLWPANVNELWVTNQNTLLWGHVLWLWGHGFWWWGLEF